MSILIKGMEMPKDCPMCPMAHWNKLDEFTGCEIKKRFFSKEELNTNYRPAFCPLVPVPPHGRLIDADALRDNNSSVIEINSPDGTVLAIDVAIIDDAPTVIPASEEGET